MGELLALVLGMIIGVNFSATIEQAYIKAWHYLKSRWG